MKEGLKDQGGINRGDACQSNTHFGHCRHCIDETATSRGRRTKGREEDNISHLDGIRYYSQHPLVVRKERKEKARGEAQHHVKEKSQKEKDKSLEL